MLQEIGSSIGVGSPEGQPDFRVFAQPGARGIERAANSQSAPEPHRAARYLADPTEQRRVVEQFAHACAAGDLEALVAVLHADVTGEFDSGGFIPGAPLEPARGSGAVAMLLHRAFAGSSATFDVESINGEPGVVVGLAGRMVAAIALEVVDGRVIRVRGMGNSTKLRGKC